MTGWVVKRPLADGRLLVRGHSAASSNFAVVGLEKDPPLSKARQSAVLGVSEHNDRLTWDGYE